MRKLWCLVRKMVIWAFFFILVLVIGDLTASLQAMSRYLDFLENIRVQSSCVSEDSALVLPDELHLQSLWFAGQMGREFVAVDGRRVEVVQFGYWNHAAGPDFLHVAVEIDGQLRTGPLEIDLNVANWTAHGHADNPDFDDVVLHVVFERGQKDRFTRTSNHRSVPQVVVPEETIREALQIPLMSQASAHPGRCFQPLAEMRESDVEALMLEAARCRAKRKAARRSRTIDALGEEEWLWQAVAETLGYRPNKLAMTLLAQRFPMSHLKAMPELCEVVLFGAAGFLTAKSHDAARDDSRGYLRDLWEGWWQVRDNYEPSQDRCIPWRFSGIRPVNHPQRRVACLASIAKSWDAFRQACGDVEQVGEFLRELRHPYWNHHYTVHSKRSERELALMGADRIRDFQINHLMPTQLADEDDDAWKYYRELPAPALSEKVDRASLRLFGDTDRRKNYLRKAWQHQALLQIYQDFCLCDVSDCLQCPFPEQLAQWKE